MFTSNPPRQLRTSKQKVIKTLQRVLRWAHALVRIMQGLHEMRTFSRGSFYPQGRIGETEEFSRAELLIRQHFYCATKHFLRREADECVFGRSLKSVER